MTTLFAMLFAATVLSDLDDEAESVATRPAIDVAAESAAATNAPSATGKTVTIESDRADYDRRDGVILFEGHVYAQDPEFNMHADRLHVFVDSLNQLKRIVVSGHVVITNGLKNGSCDRATYVKNLHRIIMYGNGKDPARLVDNTKKRSVIDGAKITFWTDSEQVEVDTPVISLEGGLPKDAVPMGNMMPSAVSSPTNAPAAEAKSAPVGK